MTEIVHGGHKLKATKVIRKTQTKFDTRQKNREKKLKEKFNEKAECWKSLRFAIECVRERERKRLNVKHFFPFDSFCKVFNWFDRIVILLTEKNNNKNINLTIIFRRIPIYYENQKKKKPTEIKRKKIINNRIFVMWHEASSSDTKSGKN